ncbi:Rab-GTPase-TBC domain, partial [Dillenia turbinata]
MNMKTNNNSRGEEEGRRDNTLTALDSRFNQTLRNVQGLLKGRSFPGKVLITRRTDPVGDPSLQEQSPKLEKSLSETDVSHRDDFKSVEEDVSTSKSTPNSSNVKLKPSLSNIETKEVQKSVLGARATDSARVMKFTKELSGTTVILETLRELAWSGVLPYLRPTVWRLLLGYAPPNSDRREGVLRRKRLEYLDCVAQYYDIPESERSDDEINMLRQIAVDCPRTVPDVTFFQQNEVQKSLERILYTWPKLELGQARKVLASLGPGLSSGLSSSDAQSDVLSTHHNFPFSAFRAIRHPASGYVQGINDLVTPFLVVFLSEHLEGSVDQWSITDLSQEKISDVEADCYWCLSKLLDGMQDHYTFAQPGIQRLVFKLKEVVRRID